MLRGQIESMSHLRTSLVSKDEKMEVLYNYLTSARFKDKVENIIRPGHYGIRKIIPGKDEHPTPKPPELAAHFIRLHTQPGDTVLDPFAGSGTTLEVAERLGRNSIGIDLSEKYVKEIIEPRMGAINPLFNLLGSQEGK